MKNRSIWIVVAAVALLATALWSHGFGVLAPDAEVPSRTGAKSAMGAEPQSAEARIALKTVPEPGQSGDETSPSPRGFDEIYEDLIHEFSENAYRPDLSDLKKGDYAERVSQLCEEMAYAVRDAGERTMFKIAAVRPPWESRELKIEERVCTLIVDINLQTLSVVEGQSNLRSSLVAQMLGYMPYSESLAQFVFGLLNEKPYLEAVHEQALLGLAEEARGDLAFLSPFVKDLLVTLWKNLDAA